MSDFLENIAFRQYENMLPEGYDGKPLFQCKCCGEDIFSGEEITIIENNVFCCQCAIRTYAYKEIF